MPRQSNWTLAVDFGTTVTAAATLHGRDVQLVRIDGDDRMQSMVFWREGDGARKGELLLGDHADRFSALAPDCLERAPKRRVGDDFMHLGDAEISVVSVVAAILRKVRDAAIRERGGPPDELYLTHPARWAEDGPELEQLTAAAAKAELPEPVFLAEPVAAAIHFATAELDVGEYVAVYDFGGGTFDTAVLQRVKDGFEVRGAGGDDRLGGEDFDDALYEWLGSQLEPDQWEQLQTSRELRWRRANRELLREARRAKEALSETEDAPVFVPSPVERDILVNKVQLRELIEDRVQETVDELRITIESAGLEANQLAAIYLAGGSSAIPLVASLIAQEFEMVPRTLDDPKTVVARGAAIAASHGAVVPKPIRRPISSYPPPDPLQRRAGQRAAEDELGKWPPPRPRPSVPDWPPRRRQQITSIRSPADRPLG